MGFPVFFTSVPFIYTSAPAESKHLAIPTLVAIKCKIPGAIS